MRIRIIIYLTITAVISGCFGSTTKTEDFGSRVNVIKPSTTDFVVVADFSNPISLEPIEPGWYHQIFNFIDPMSVSFTKHKGVKSARFETDDGGSMLLRHVEVPLAEYPVLTWKWFVEKAIQSNVDERSGKGDDSSARIFISFAVDGEAPRRMEIIWARQLARGDKKFTHKFNHYVVRGKGDPIGIWQDEQLDLEKIYEQFWPDKKSATIDALAIFCDSDDTDESTVAYFSGLVLSRRATE